jgi:hypothetical protein
MDSSSTMEVWMSAVSRRLITALATVALLSSLGIVSAEARVSGPTMDCPFSLLPLLHLPKGASVVYCGTSGGGYLSQ